MVKQLEHLGPVVDSVLQRATDVTNHCWNLNPPKTVPQLLEKGFALSIAKAGVDTPQAHRELDLIDRVIPNFDFHLEKQVIFANVLGVHHFSDELQGVLHVVVDLAAPVLQVHLFVTLGEQVKHEINFWS